MSLPPVSIIISCFNYDRFVGEAISSALQQRGRALEVIVVDDGSTDQSLPAIRAFGDRVAAIVKNNGGQASALNAGFEASRGDPVIFLDADDLLLPSAADSVARALADPTAAKAHWSMPVIDQNGRRTGALQDPDLAEGDLREQLLREGPFGDATMGSPPMSGNGFSRAFLEQVMPIPETLYRTAADEYLFALAPTFGRIVRIEPQSLYRIHGTNEHATWSFERSLAFQLAHHRLVSEIAAEVCRREHPAFDEQDWTRHAWPLRTARVVEAVETVLPPGTSFALLDGAALGVDRTLRGRAAIPFPEADDEFGGCPADDRAALAELDRMSAKDVRHFVLAWPAFWWMEEYPKLASALRERQVLIEDPDVVIFGPRRQA